MIISAKIINKPRKVRECAVCGYAMNFSQLRLFGSAESGDRPYVIYVHENCGKYDKDVLRKLQAAQQMLAADAIESMASINYPPKKHSNYIGGAEL